MNIDSIKNGFVIDHIKAGKGMEIYRLLKLKKLSCPVAMIMNAQSFKMGKKDVIKIDSDINLNLDILGYVDPDITVNVIKDSVIVEKKKLELPEKMTDIIFCKNPRCISSTEQELSHVFTLADRGRRIYRCIYCDAEA
ncbi:MAG: aspartate carbamoyltransferase regulatory subunit [Clostridia bacterium]|nr:aspartate carbamoyltransferase regulatory subunit [Clostridia bacterium]